MGDVETNIIEGDVETNIIEIYELVYDPNPVIVFLDTFEVR